MDNMRDLLQLKNDLGADTITIRVDGKDARVTVRARAGWDDIEQTAVFSVETLTAFIGDPWLMVREGLREFATANAEHQARCKASPECSCSPSSSGGAA
jgi:hypothetical protein